MRVAASSRAWVMSLMRPMPASRRMRWRRSSRFMRR